MIEETIQGIIVVVVALAPVLYIFLRRWAARHSQAKRQNDAESGGTERKLRFPFRRSRSAERADPAEAVPTEPRPIFDRLRPPGEGDKTDSKRRPAGGLANWTPMMSSTGNQGSAQGNAQTPGPAVSGLAISAAERVGAAAKWSAKRSAQWSVGRVRSGEGGGGGWSRVEALPLLKRAIVLSEILGPPRALSPPTDPFRPE